MSTLTPPALSRVYSWIDPYLQYEKRSGIANSGSPGYHTSRDDLIRQGRRDNYSILCPADKRGNGSYASGIDITFTKTSEQALVHRRLREACTPDGDGNYDPRIECVREFIGTFDGWTVSGYNRVATGSGSRSRVGWFPSGFSDISHRWHEHISVLRDRCNDDNEMRGLAEVICGLARGALGWQGEGASEPQPFVWDGVSFPGADKFAIGSQGAWVTWLGKRLVAHGWTGYSDGPGPTMTAVDQAGVKWFQELQGWTGADADGIPGEQSWALLAADPKPVKPVEKPDQTGPEPKPEPQPEPEKPHVVYPTPTSNEAYLDLMRDGVTGSDTAWYVRAALKERGVNVELGGDYPTEAVRTYQRDVLKDDPKYCDGILGPTQATRLFADAGMPVKVYTDHDKPNGGQWVNRPKADPAPKPEEPTVNTKFTVLQVNQLRRTDPVKARKDWPERVGPLVAAIKAAKPDVVLVCESSKTSARDIHKRLGDGWSYYPVRFNKSSSFSPLCVYWRTSVFTRRVAPFEREYSDNENRFLLRVPLVHIASGKVVTFYSTHLENDGDPDTNGHNARRTEAREFARWTLDGAGIFGADLNSTTRSGGANKEKPRPILRAAGWKFLTDQKGVPNREYASHHGGLGKLPKGPWIDDMGFQGVTYVDGALIRTDQTDCTDHHILSITVKI